MSPLAEPFGRPSFLRPWWTHLAPFWLKSTEGEAGPFGRAHWYFAAGFGPGDYSSPHWEAGIESRLERMAERGLLLPRVVEGSPLETWTLGRQPEIIPVGVAPRLSLAAGWDVIKDRRSSKSWGTYRRKRRRLAELGDIRVVHVADADSLSSWLPVVFDIYQARANIVPRGHLWLSARGRAFMSEWMHNLANEGSLDLSLLLVGDVPVAFTLGIRDPEVYYLYGLAFDPRTEHARWSPGEQLLVHLLERSAEQGLGHFDFLFGNESYKQFWADEFRQVNTHILGSRTVKAAWISFVRSRQHVKRLISRH